MVSNIFARRPARRGASGFTLIELIAVIVILGVVSIVATAAYADLRREANWARSVAFATQFKAAIGQVNAAWYVANGISAMTDVPKIGDGTIDVTDRGWPVDVNGATSSDMTPAQCAAVFNKLLQMSISQVGLATGPPRTYNAGYSSDWCFWTAVGSNGTIFDSSDGNFIIYDPRWGTVMVTNNSLARQIIMP